MIVARSQNSVETLDRADLAIVGNGIAGLTAAVEARRLDPDLSVVVLTTQSHPTINTPALKQFATGKMTREQLLAYPVGTERTQRIHVVHGQVEEIRAREKYLCLTGGRGFGYHTLLLATGSKPTGLPPDVPGQSFDGVLTLHSLRDYLDLRRRLPEVEEAVVVGGGSHAIETVAGLLHWGVQVHWLIRGSTFLPRMLDKTASEMVLEGIRHAGARIHLETEILGVIGRVGMVAGVMTTQQEMLPCQLVLVCTGTKPQASLADFCDLPMKREQGILVDDWLRTSVPGVYAAGDVAALRDPLTGKYAPRAQWHAAVLQGRTAASAITGTGQPERFGVTWHATRLGDLSMLTVGNPLAWPEDIVPMTMKRKNSYCRLAVIDDRLVGYLSLGPTQPDSLAIKRIIDEGLSVREITKGLLHGKFDARAYFSRKRSYAAQRMLTTGQLPTPLPPVHEHMIVASAGHTPQPVGLTDPLVLRELQATRQQVSTEPLAQTGPHRLIPAQAGWPRTDDLPQIANRPTLVEADPVEPVRGDTGLVPVPTRQFISAPNKRAHGQAENPHPSRSLWHYTDKHAAFKGRNNATTEHKSTRR